MDLLFPATFKNQKMGKASKKTALSTKTNAAPGQKVLTKAQEKKAKLKAEIAAAKVMTLHCVY